MSEPLENRLDIELLRTILGISTTTNKGSGTIGQKEYDSVKDYQAAETKYNEERK